MASEAEVLERPATAETDQAEPDIYVSCTLIDEGFNYRRRYDPKKMAELRADMKQRAAGNPRDALIYPVELRVLDNGRFQLIVGGRRFKAFRDEFGIEAQIRARARRMTDAEATALMMAENGLREDPSIIEDAEGAARMLGECKGDRAEAAARLGWELSKLNRRLALMNAVQTVRDAYLDYKIGVGHVEILAALRKEVQERVMEVLLQQEKLPTVDQLKAMAEASLQNLETAIFDKKDCAGCQYNTGEQQALFDVSFAGSRCTNKECYGAKTEDELEKRRKALTDTYQVVRIVRPGDNSTVTPLRADGKRPVGAEQAAACRTCSDFGACVSAVPDTLGKTYTDVCFNQECNDGKVEAFRKSQQPPEQPADTKPTDASDASGQGKAETPAQARESKPAQPKAQANSLRNAIKEYREQIWRQVFHRAALKLPMIQSRALLVALLAHRSSYVEGSKAMDAINKALGTEVPIHASSTSKQMRSLLEFDQNKLATAFGQLPAFVSNDMPIRDVEGYLNALSIKLEDHWKVNETFFDILTKTELDAVCVEIGLADAAGKHYGPAKNGSKKEFIAAMLKVEGFNYVGAIPKMMRWDPKV